MKNIYERFALGEYFYAFPNDKTYDEVLDMLLKGSDEVIVWHEFRALPREAVVEFVDALRAGLMVTFIPREETP